jgi:multicomponent Na+:H+ antiporter subunit D
LVLAGLPLGVEHQGRALIDAAANAGGYRFLAEVLSIASGLTGAAILRVGGRIFWGLGPDPGDEAEAPSEEEREKNDRPVWLMLVPVLALIAADFGLGAFPVEAEVRRAAASFTDAAVLAKFALGVSGWTVPAPPPSAEAPMTGPILGLSVALGLAALQLGKEHLPRAMVAASDLLLGSILRMLDSIHDGIVGDYVAWLALGLLVFGAVLAMG